MGHPNEMNDECMSKTAWGDAGPDVVSHKAAEDSQGMRMWRAKVAADMQAAADKQWEHAELAQFHVERSAYWERRAAKLHAELNEGYPFPGPSGE